MHQTFFAIVVAGALAAPALAQPAPFPKDFRTQEITTNGATIHVRVGGQGSAVVLLHGFGETGDMWAPLARSEERRVGKGVSDRRGPGGSTRTAGGYETKIRASDVAGVLDALSIYRPDLVTIGIAYMVGFESSALPPSPFPKDFRTQEITTNGATIHVRVGGQGSAVVLLHGFGETGDMWAPLA